ncbi:MAG: hypothetical protein NTV62_03570, partial [Candidatus Gribaldobacteria bacterium]|nr:hypothetical protein [Candidatus Gribaldobacteria bacterium]
MTEEQIDETLRLSEPVVKAIAKKFSVPGLEYVDLLQVGRITVWRLAKERNILPENFNDFLGLIKIVIKRAFINEQIAAKRQKRKPLNEATSIDAPLDENTKFSLQQILAAPTAMDASETLERLKSIAFITRHPEAIKTTLWFLVEMLEIEHSDIPKKLNSCLFIKMKLARFLRIFFSNSPFQAINYAWPKEFLPQQMAKAPMRYWQGQRGKTRAIKALRWTLAQISDDISEYPFL